MEVRGAKVIRFFNKLGLFRSQKPLPTKRLAEAMIKSVKVLGDGEYSVKGQDILGYA